MVRPHFRDMNDPLIIKFKETLGNQSQTSSPTKSVSKRQRDLGAASPDPTPLKKDPKTGQMWKLVDEIKIDDKVKLNLPEHASKEEIEKATKDVMKKKIEQEIESLLKAKADLEGQK